ncbi:hypothetical protein IFM89_010138 [Coptis chinensis]|uniref:Potassium transporter n=1 Tax=Coptis chinensis TaxID=261450 RepID=A0A835I9F5_9MAGN|nr:hypothetical protein IFM89_010138 [Coptis chinensis]
MEENCWVDGNEVESEYSDSIKFSSRPPAGSDSLRRRLLGKSGQDDFVEVESGYDTKSHHSEDRSLLYTLTLAFQTLGVVYGNLGTSPLYVFSDVFSKAPVQGREDVLGALSLVIYTIALFPFAKYVFIVLQANDNGEGGTFALYSLICRYAKVGMLPNQQPADKLISSFKLNLPTPETKRIFQIKEKLESSATFRTILLLLVLMGTSMIIGDGILTPAMSVMSVVSGLQGEISGFDEDAVVMTSTSILVALFSIQRFGTSKVGLTFAPVLALWFFCLASIGIYNVFRHDLSVLKAINPAYIYLFFQRNGRKAWSALGGCVLCITGQASHLVKYPSAANRVFYASVPGGLFWPVFAIATLAAMIASQAMISATFSCIKQSMALSCFPRLKIVQTSSSFMEGISGIAEVGVMMVRTIFVTLVLLLIWQKKILLALTFPAVFGTLEAVYLSSVLTKIREGGWLPLAFSACFLFVMFTWNYGSVLKYQSEVREKISKQVMFELGSSLGTVRVPGIGLIYNELVQGIPSILGQFLVNLPAMHSTIVFVCVKYVTVPIVPQEERFHFHRLCPKDYHMFRCVARYGYKDAWEEVFLFEKLLIESLEEFLRLEAKHLCLENLKLEIQLETETSGSKDEVPSMVKEEEQLGQVKLVMDDSRELRIPLLSRRNLVGTVTEQRLQDLPASPLYMDEDPGLEYELFALREAKDAGVTHFLTHSNVRARKKSLFLKKLVINYFYAFMRRNCRAGAASLSNPNANILQVSMTYMV